MKAPIRRVDDASVPALARTAPHNVEAERQLLGAILVNNETYYRVSDFLEPAHFFLEPHKVIFERTALMIRAGKTASPITLKTFFPGDQQIADMSPTQYLLRLASDATTIINAEDYGRQIQELATRRNLIRIGEDMVNIAFDAPVDMPPRAQIEDAERRLFELAEAGRYDGGFVTFSDALRGSIEMAAAAFQRQGKLSGISTGISSLDQRLGGLQRSDLVILAGRPAMGKTSLATNIAFNIAAAYRAEERPDGTLETVDGGIVGFFSLEMSSEQLATRILSEQAEIPSNKIRRGDISDAEFEKLVGASQMMQSVPLYVDQTGGISIAQLAARARRLKRQKGLDILIVDYLQLLTGSSKKGDNRVQEITEITTGLKALAKELNTPIVALSQLSRQVENREDKRPQLADLRESGSIEQDADVVMFVYREEYYLKNQEPQEKGTDTWFKWEEKFNRMKGIAEVIVGKQRHGPTGSVELHFAGEYTRFSDLIRDDHLPERHE
ncbi:replicative DNA helicase [Pinisolibacter aquiterrae]|uniref:replicative DNA helicase n=1 Tax=Pinisolibacter aquiterrae TaxID=2815579 RepID=UPI001C3C2A70|nr:replicative DNA helicase [Pinisolibacter aquiterrae]MBV5264215.1 replicative DNA helicase [Pinisolibacter aquiterrae]MCC8233691.1 replicative DNA helicase [Pinisolibacter aquiterrae]